MNKTSAVIKLQDLKSGKEYPLSKIKNQSSIYNKDDIEDFEKMFYELQEDLITVNNVKTFKDGNYIFFHTSYNFIEEKSGFDVLKIKEDNISAHWSVCQDKISKNKLTNDKFVNEIIKNSSETKKNKQIIKNIIYKSLIKNNIKLMRRHVSNNMDNKISFEFLFKEFNKRGLSISYDKIKLIIGEGEYVLSICEGTFLNKNVYFYDFFKLKDSLIINHWDAMDDRTKNYIQFVESKDDLYVL